MKEYEKYSIVWKEFPPSVGFVEATGAHDGLFVPLFLTGKDLEIFEQSGGYAFYPFNVLRGILVGLQDEPPTIDLSSIKPFLLKGLFLLQSEFDLPTMEDLILSCSAHIRENQGVDPSICSLRTGREALPNSQKIASDLIMTIWRKAVNIKSESMLSEIGRIGQEIDPANVDSTIAPNLVYIVFVALFLSKSKELAIDYYTNSVLKYVKEGILRDRIELLREGKRFSLTELDE